MKTSSIATGVEVERLKVPPNGVWTFDIPVVGSSGVSLGIAGYQVRGVVVNLSGITAELGTPLKTVLCETYSDWDVIVQGDDAHSALVIKVIGSADETVRCQSLGNHECKSKETQ